MMKSLLFLASLFLLSTHLAESNFAPERGRLAPEGVATNSLMKKMTIQSLVDRARTKFSAEGFVFNLEVDYFDYSAWASPDLTSVRGLKAPRDIDESILIHTPYDMIITTEKILDTSTEAGLDVELAVKVRKLAESGEGGTLPVGFGEHAVFTWWLAREGERVRKTLMKDGWSLDDLTFLQLYILDLQQNLIPSIYTTPVFLDSSSLDLIFPTDPETCLSAETKYNDAKTNAEARREISYLRQAARIGYDALENSLRGQKITWETYLWSWMVVDSRFWELDVDAPPLTHKLFYADEVDNDIMFHMAPIHDLVNFGDETNIAYYEYSNVTNSLPSVKLEKRGFTLYAEELRRKGDEVYFYYQDNCREYFEVHYGFSDIVINSKNCSWDFQNN